MAAYRLEPPHNTQFIPLVHPTKDPELPFHLETIIDRQLSRPSLTVNHSQAYL